MIRTVIALSFVATASLALTGCHGRRDFSDPAQREKMSQWVGERVADELEDLDATDAQMKALAGVEKPLLDEGFRFMEAHKAAKQTFIAEWNADEADAAKVHGLIDERVDHLRKVLHVAADAALKIHATLTPEQRKELGEELDHHHH